MYLCLNLILELIAAAAKGERLHCPWSRKKSGCGQRRTAALPVEEKKERPRSKKSGCIARGREKRAAAVKGKQLHCPWSRKKSFHGQRKAGALPVEEKKERPRSKE